jgi:CheY-like chemotaxis protein
MTTDVSIKASEDHYKKFKRKFGSFDPKQYDEIITKLSLQTKEGYKHNNNNTLQYHNGQRIQREGLSNQTTGKRKVLVVDDEPDICMVYQMVLEDAGYECNSYTDPIKALHEFKPYFYDLILLDIKMPVLNGFELCKKIREVDETVHIVFITASEAYYEKFRSQHFPELGKINYIQKPVANEELVLIVDMIISNSVTID